MSDLRDLYQEVIVDHARRPRNFGALDGAHQRADGHNPLCGDQVTVFVRVNDGVVTEVSFQGSGCAVSMASASMMTDFLKAKSVAAADEAFRAFHQLVTEGLSDDEAFDALGKLAVFSGVREFPARVKCASLPWHTAVAAIRGQRAPVSTDEEEAWPTNSAR